MSFVKLEDLPELTLATTTLLYGEKTPYTALADAGKIPLSLLDARYLMKAGDTMAGALDMDDNLIQNIEQAAFNLSPATSPGVGKLQWNSTDGTLDLGLLGGVVVAQLSEENVAYVTQKTGETIPDGRVVMVIGSSGQRIQVTPTNISFGNPLDLAFGVTTENIDDSQDGYVTPFGLVRGINTSSWDEGTFLWADPTTPGLLTDVRPTAPDRPVFVGVVIKKGGTGVGSIFVLPHNQPNLSLLADVYAPVVNDGDYLRWSAANSRWQTSAT